MEIKIPKFLKKNKNVSLKTTCSGKRLWKVERYECVCVFTQVVRWEWSVLSPKVQRVPGGLLKSTCADCCHPAELPVQPKHEPQSIPCKRLFKGTKAFPNDYTVQYKRHSSRWWTSQATLKSRSDCCWERSDCTWWGRKCTCVTAAFSSCRPMNSTPGAPYLTTGQGKTGFVIDTVLLDITTSDTRLLPLVIQENFSQ